MLNILRPDLLQYLDFPAGLFAPAVAHNQKPILIIKAPKEHLLTARLNKGFKAYIMPLEILGKTTAFIISAFFDDSDEPLIIGTPLFDESQAINLISTLLSEILDVYLVDELNRGFLSYSAYTNIPNETRNLLKNTHLFPFNKKIAKEMLGKASYWFGMRNNNDDAAAITINFNQSLFPEDIFTINTDEKSHSFHGGNGYSQVSLIREQPGYFQEHDIIFLLQRIFKSEQIYMGPLKTTDGEEIADIIVLTDHHLLLIQAKDSPNNENILRNSIDQKKRKTIKNLKKAIKQTKGSIRYISSNHLLKMILNDQELDIPIKNLEVVSLIIIKEMFSDSYQSYSDLLLDFIDTTKIACLALDYSGLIEWTYHLKSEHDFFNAYKASINFGCKRGIFPKLRFNLSEEIE